MLFVEVVCLTVRTQVLAPLRAIAQGSKPGMNVSSY